jgi:hypothetical protein
MTAYTSNCRPADCGPCGTLPAGFVRLRYFYGKRLAAADFLDEQRYHAGKLRFHQQRLHGSGVLCGLGVDLFSSDPADATILRVHRGAALDGCGREVIVGWDQCLDVDAWLGKKLAAVPDFLAGAGTTFGLCVVLRYRECPSSPEAAPRDACSCDTTGCDYGRIREEFELDLIAVPKDTIVPAVFPARGPMLAGIARAPGGAGVVDQLATLATAGCPVPDPDGWLEIACFTATLTPPAGASDRTHVKSIANIVPAETILYQTALLQELVMRDLAATMEGGSLADGPQIASVAIDNTATPKTLVVKLTAPVLAKTVPAAVPFVLVPFDATTGWGSPVAVTATLSAGADAFTIDAGAALTSGARFRIGLEADPNTPITDAVMRPLRPLRFSYHFQLAADPATAGNLIVAAPPIA